MSIIVSIIILPLGFLYSFGYSFWLLITLKNWKAFFVFWWKLFDGFAYALGYILYNLALGLDLAWNVNGELIEDSITAKENTTFGDKETTVSASVGKLELDNKLNKTGKGFSRVLNVVFWQRAHAIDSWNFQTAKKELRAKYFLPKEKKK